MSASPDLNILGAGGFAREVLSLLEDCGDAERVIGYVEENSRRVGTRMGDKPVLDASLLGPLPRDRALLVGGVGSPLRARWYDDLARSGFRFQQAIHPDVRVHRSVLLGSGTVVCSGVRMTCDIRVGRHGVLNLAATIGHDCELGDFVTVSPGTMISGNVSIGEKTWIGSGAVIREKIRIGSRSYIGAGAVVVKDIPDDSLAIGVPARVTRELTMDDWKQLT